MNLELRVFDKRAESFDREDWRHCLWYYLNNLNKYTIHQWTGALDKKNRQIFEGDIVLFDNPDPYDGQDQLTKIVGYNTRTMGFRLYNFSHEINQYGGQEFFPEQVEVIGNIFEGAVKDGVDYGKYLKIK